MLNKYNELLKEQAEHGAIYADISSDIENLKSDISDKISKKTNTKCNFNGIMIHVSTKNGRLFTYDIEDGTIDVYKKVSDFKEIEEIIKGIKEVLND